ncbi:DUF2087 domain-containing protein [Brevibacillus daliensis]|uniref:DUF2087 domain-containing protein n=1 Tax=Brevibacillus daliensis TaxID=2892995 RepID=UPI001E3A637E|nr:DUF2087 domain-containing protein [Brevibacillus daliensis]
MQIELLVLFHKTMGDVNRLRIVSLLAHQPMSGLALAERLGISPATITHHTQKLKKLGLLVEKRDKNTIIFHLLPTELKRYSDALLPAIMPVDKEPLEQWQFIRDHEREENNEMAQFPLQKEKEHVWKSFFTTDHKLKTIPAQWKKKLFVLEKLVENLVVGQTYSEKEISEYLKQYHEDFATLRRELIMNNIMYRNNNVYTLNPREMWKEV